MSEVTLHWLLNHCEAKGGNRAGFGPCEALHGNAPDWSPLYFSPIVTPSEIVPHKIIIKKQQVTHYGIPPECQGSSRELLGRGPSWADTSRSGAR